MMKMPMPSIDSVKVAVRVRPFSQIPGPGVMQGEENIGLVCELDKGGVWGVGFGLVGLHEREKNSGSKCVISMHSRTTTIIQDPKNPEHTKTFTFDLAYWTHNGFQKDKDGVFISADPSSKFAGQRDVFHDLGRGILDSAWQGYNTTLLAYGQTGSGKSYSVIGFGANKGIIPNVCEEIFQAIENPEKNQEYQVTFSMLEIYNEHVRDLLSKTKKPGGLKVREDQQLGFYVDGLKSVPCENYAQIERLMEQGTKIRTTASTNMNASSSRSHMVITIQFKQVFLDRDLSKQSSINLVDLAGSERQKSSGSEGDRLREGSRVNLSLTNLGNVISALADAAMGKKVLHIPYGDSVLTKLLPSALGGNSRTTLIAAIKLPACWLRSPTDQMSWVHQLEQARSKWQQHYVAIAQVSSPPPPAEADNLAGGGGGGGLAPFTQTCANAWVHARWIIGEQQMMKTFLHILNVNEDPQHTGVLKHFIEAGSCDAGQAASNAITLQGLGISDKHASFTNSDGKVTVTPHGKCKVIVNGVPITTKTKLQHLSFKTCHGEGTASPLPTSGSPRLLPPPRPESQQHGGSRPLSSPFSTCSHREPFRQAHWSRPPLSQKSFDDLPFRTPEGAGPSPASLASLLCLGLPRSHDPLDAQNVPGSGSQDLHRGAAALTSSGLPLSPLSPPRDRMIMGSNSACLYIGFPSERGSEDLSRFDYDFFQLERAASEGVSVDKLGAVNSGDGKADPSVLAVFQDYIKLMPLVAEANQMSEELKKGLNMELKVKNLASSDSRGCDLRKEVMVKVTNQRTRQVWIWSKAKFINRKFLMEELYQRFLDGEDSHLAQVDDPFWDPAEVIHLGSAHIWLQSLAYCMKFEEQVEFLNCDRLEEAVLHIHIGPCSPTGQARGEEDVVIDPLELLGKRMDFQIRIVRGLGTKWLKEGAERGVQVGYRIYDLPNALYTKSVWKIVNPQIEETVQFTALNASQEFLNYLQTNALIVDLWGLQEGCAELSCSQPGLMVTGEGHIMVDTKKISAVMDKGQTTSNQIPELYLKLLKLEQETELLRNINRVLREENVFLKETIEKTGSSQQAHKPSSILKLTGMTEQLPAAREINQMCTQQASYDREFAKAPKVFYQSMNVARGQFLKLRHYKPPIHQKYIYTWIFSYRTPTERWQKTSDLQKGVRGEGFNHAA
ncbi:kinesin-like protein KIF28P [Kogia breviceps]|uniref:kinesin-like protein KIF28P n=1 Tax=Kogia breviceps TaxID=27615 RepID=UPI0034D35D85